MKTAGRSHVTAVKPYMGQCCPVEDGQRKTRAELNRAGWYS